MYTPQFIQYVGLLLEQILTLGVTVLLFFYIFRRKKSIPQCAVFCAIIFLNIFSIDLLRSSDFAVKNDFYELIKPISFLLYFALGYTTHFSSDETSLFCKWLMLNFLIISILGILEATVGSVNSLFSIVYKSFRGALVKKAVFSFISPYCLATILTLPFFYFFICFFSFKKLKYLIAFLVCALSLLLTQSKTVFLGIILSSGIMIVIVFFSKWIIGRKRILYTSFFLTIVIVLMFPIMLIFAQKRFAYLYTGLEVFFNAFSSGSVMKILYAQPTTQLRFEQLKFAFENQDTIPLIGVAIGKSVLMPESFYAMYLYRTGLIGIVIHTFMVFFAGRRSFLLAKYHSSRDEKQLFCFYFSIFIFFISLIFSYFSSAVTDQTRIAFFFYFLIGHLYSIPLTQFFGKKKLISTNEITETLE